MPHSRVYLEYSRTIFTLKIEHSRQKLYADEVLVYFIQQSKTKSDLNFFKEEQ
jgi:hypothetical protein